MASESQGPQGRGFEPNWHQRLGLQWGSYPPWCDQEDCIWITPCGENLWNTPAPQGTTELPLSKTGKPCPVSATFGTVEFGPFHFPVVHGDPCDLGAGDDILRMRITALPLVATCLVVQAIMHGPGTEVLCLLRVCINNALVRTTGGVVPVIFKCLFSQRGFGGGGVTNPQRVAVRCSSILTLQCLCSCGTMQPVPSPVQGRTWPMTQWFALHPQIWGRAAVATALGWARAEMCSRTPGSGVADPPRVHCTCGEVLLRHLHVPLPAPVNV